MKKFKKYIIITILVVAGFVAFFIIRNQSKMSNYEYASIYIKDVEGHNPSTIYISALDEEEDFVQIIFDENEGKKIWICETGWKHLKETVDNYVNNK